MSFVSGLGFMPCFLFYFEAALLTLGSVLPVDYLP